MIFSPEILCVNESDPQKQLTITTQSSVQPAILLRLGVFVPNSRAVKSGDKHVIDVSDSFKELSYARQEGYDDIQIRGERLNITTDFSVWMGVIGAFSLYGATAKSNKITLPFKEFAKLCNYPSRQINHCLRTKIFDSLAKLGTKVVQFQRKDGSKSFFTQLLKTALMDREADTITLEADPRLWELYLIDYKILLRKHPYDELKGREVAQALYTYIASLPDGFAPISFKRFRERILLTSPVFEQNRLIKTALKAMADIGYIEFHLTKDGRDNIAHIHKRNKKLKALA
ncbi:RepB family plasmid replication initiator protein [Yersinia ruckeri]|uniref:RepB family plasmid replication initiator protein n=1 Tax=Yersinia ruckeri TaxID=29486 RepID=UPI0020BFCC47|nr:RepB family plasmid replication initiator protein [Yersinia ruckeri]MCK8586568.1 RepB family plasmid replication initiator protein [Yersinia ruckeri]